MLNIDIQISQNLKLARINAGYKTAKDFALQKMIKYTTYSQHESGKRKLSSKVIARYCQLLNISPNWLLTNKNIQQDLREQSFSLISNNYDETVTSSKNNIINLSLLDQKKSLGQFLATSHCFGQKTNRKVIDSIVKKVVSVYIEMDVPVSYEIILKVSRNIYDVVIQATDEVFRDKYIISMVKLLQIIIETQAKVDKDERETA